MPSCTLVLGTPRSGTSAVAGVLHRLGVHMGERLMEATEMNEAGFFQCLDCEEACDPVEPWMPAPGTVLPAGVRAVLQEIVRQRCRQGRDWGAKFRLAAYVLPDLLAACTDPVRLVVTSRPRCESVASLSRWLQPWEQPAAEIIDRATEAVRRAVATAGVPTLAVEFGSLLANPAGEVARLASFVGCPVTAEAVTHVAPHLRRHGG